MLPTTKQPRVVIITRPTWYAQLLARHGTREQARFFLESRDQHIDSIEEQHREFEAGLRLVLNAIPVTWRRSRVDRADLDRFLFEPEDLVVAVGQDGLVANVAKYLNGQIVIGINPHPQLIGGILVPFAPHDTARLLEAAVTGRGEMLQRTMVEARLDDGQRLLALNEIFVGHSTHQSARYELLWNDARELQSSSGVIVSTGTGCTGWALSIHRQRISELTLPQPTQPQLVFFTREAWPSVATGTSCTEGLIEADQQLRITSRMNDGGVLFGDGIEADRIEFNWGRRVEIGVAPERLRVMVA